MVESFLASRSYAKADDCTVVFYMVGYDSAIEYPGLIKRRWDPVVERDNFQLYKPHIMLQSLEFEGSLIYFDTDILLGKRFSLDSLRCDLDYPLACVGPLNHVYHWEVDSEGNSYYHDENLLMSYYGVPERTTAYMWTSMLSYNQSCKDFLIEWCSIMDNVYFHIDGRTKSYFPFGDETAFNVLMWKRKCVQTLPRYFVNTTLFETMRKVENDDGYTHYQDNFENNSPPVELYERCDSSDQVQFYHGMKDHQNLLKTLSWMICSK